MSQQSKKVMISSTALDLPEHRKEVLDACLRQGMLPLMMEHMPASDAEAISASPQIERDEGNTAEAIEAATKTYQLAWCDGPPFAYHWGLVAAQKHLQEFGAAEPSMPPFDESKFEPMPDVEIDLDDEFHVGEPSDN